MYDLYQILVGETWYSIDPYLPLMPQTRGMRAYRVLDSHGSVIKQSRKRRYAKPI